MKWISNFLMYFQVLSDNSNDNDEEEFLVAF